MQAKAEAEPDASPDDASKVGAEDAAREPALEDAAREPALVAEDADGANGDAQAGDDETASDDEPAQAIKPTSKPKVEKAGGTKSDAPKADGGKSGGLTLAQGKEIYGKRCKTCHGATGAADTNMGKKHDIPDWTQSGWKGKWPLAKVKDITANGKPGTKMKAFKDKLTSEELDIVSRYAHSLGKK